MRSVRSPSQPQVSLLEVGKSVSGDDASIAKYLDEIAHLLKTGQAREHAYRPALQALMQCLDDVTAVNDPKRSEHGNPDFILLKTSNRDIVLGHAETKDLGVDLNRVEHTEQMTRYAKYQKLVLTDYLEFRFYQSGDKYRTVRIAEIVDGNVKSDTSAFGPLMDELRAFVTRPPESIKSGLRLAQIMGFAARRLRSEVSELLSSFDRPRENLQNIYRFIEENLLHGLNAEDFADMYAQTLVYGLFVARYNDPSPTSFSRTEARDLIPTTNPFLRQFFDHIAGASFEQDLAYSVDELCQVFQVSDVNHIVKRHISTSPHNAVEPRDPIIHFYEDFLEAYDPAQRRRLGAYYTPVPIVRFILREVDNVLRHNLNLPRGLADSQLLEKETQFNLQGKSVKRRLHRVQVLDPAVGTGTFLNELIRYVHGSFQGQEGRWPTYLVNELLPRLHGFEIMMAPYTVAHLKLGITLDELGSTPEGRLGVYLTNTLEEGDAEHPNLLDYIGLGAVITEESRQAAEIKHRYPIMVVVGNPPYSGVSVNKTAYADDLIAKYKLEPGEETPLREKKHRLDDDYVKFMAFAESLVETRGEGVMAMITNHGYIDNASYRGMRWHLMKTFDEIRVYDLHGNVTKKEKAPDGSADQNVFAIRQGVSIIVAFRTKRRKGQDQFARVQHADLWGTRKSKFEALVGEVPVTEVSPQAPLYLFNQRDLRERSNYQDGVRVDELFPCQSSGVQTSRDHFAVGFSRSELENRFAAFTNTAISDDEARQKFFASATSRKFPKGDTRGWKLPERRKAIAKLDLSEAIVEYAYRPFDVRYAGKGEDFADWPRTKVMQHVLRPNVTLVVGREGKAVGQGEWSLALAQNRISDLNLFYRGGGVVMPLWLYRGDEIEANLDAGKCRILLSNLHDRVLVQGLRPSGPRDSSKVYPLDLFDYVYAVLYSPYFRSEFKDFLDVDFPRVPRALNNSSFDHLVRLGSELRLTHTMESPALERPATTYPIAGTDEIEWVRPDGEGRVWINATQYFGGVPLDAWEFRVGGYQPAQKWLKDRLGRTLSGPEIDHYQELLAVQLRTLALMAAIEQVQILPQSDPADAAS